MLVCLRPRFSVGFKKLADGKRGSILLMRRNRFLVVAEGVGARCLTLVLLLPLLVVCQRPHSLPIESISAATHVRVISVPAWSAMMKRAGLVLPCLRPVNCNGIVMAI